jgi:WD40 repeat protein
VCAVLIAVWAQLAQLIAIGDDKLRVQPAVVAFVDGETLVTGDSKQTRYFDVATGRLLREGPPATMLSLSPDGRWLIASNKGISVDDKAQMWTRLSVRDPATGAEKRSVAFPGHYPPAVTRWSVDGKSLWLYGYGGEREVSLSALLEGQLAAPGSPGRSPPQASYTLPLVNARPKRTQHRREFARVLSRATSPSGRRVAVELMSGGVLLFDGDPHKPRRFDWAGTGGAFSSELPSRMAFLGEDRLLLTSEDSGLRVFDLERGVLARTLPSRFHSHVVVSPNQRRIVTWGFSTGVQIWDANSYANIVPHSGHRGQVTGIAFTPDGATVVTGSGDGTVRASNAASGAEMHVLDLASPVAGVAVDGAGRVAVNAYQRVEVWRLKDGVQLFHSTPMGGSNTNDGIAFVDDGRAVAYQADYGNPVYHWDLAANRTSTVENPGWAQLRKLSPDYRRRRVLSADGKAALVSDDAAAILIALPSGQEVDRVRAAEPTALAISGDGKIFAVAERAGRVLWAERGRRELRVFAGMDVTALALSPDGKTLAVGAADGRLLLWQK